jgi:hypothetical protein
VRWDQGGAQTWWGAALACTRRSLINYVKPQQAMLGVSRHRPSLSEPCASFNDGMNARQTDLVEVLFVGVNVAWPAFHAAAVQRCEDFGTFAACPVRCIACAALRYSMLPRSPQRASSRVIDRLYFSFLGDSLHDRVRPVLLSLYQCCLCG